MRDVAGKKLVVLEKGSELCWTGEVCSFER